MKDIRCIARFIKVKGEQFRIDILMKWDSIKKEYRYYTDDLKYGDKLEIILGEETYEIKDINKLRKKWNKDHGISNDPFDKFLELEDGMPNL